MEQEGARSVENLDSWSDAATIATTVAPTERVPRGLFGDAQAAGAAQSATRACTSAQDASDGGGGVHTLPPQAVIFHPDGSLAIGVDPLRIHELLEGVESEEEEEVGPRGVQAAPFNSDIDARLVSWRLAHRRHKIIFLVLLTVDIAYLLLLLGLRIGWGTQPRSIGSPALRFIIGRPWQMRRSFLTACTITDLLAALAAVREFSPVLTLFMLWSVVLVGFGIMTMPLLFLFLRVALVIAALQLRYSLSRMRSLTSPTSVYDWIASAGQGVMVGVRGLGYVSIAPFRWMTSWARRTPRAPPGADLEAGPAAPAAHADRPAEEAAQGDAQPNPGAGRAQGGRQRSRQREEAASGGRGQPPEATPGWPQPATSGSGSSLGSGGGGGWHPGDDAAVDRGVELPPRSHSHSWQSAAATERPPAAAPGAEQGAAGGEERERLQQLYAGLMRDLQQARPGTTAPRSAAASGGSGSGVEEEGEGGIGSGRGGGSLGVAAVAAASLLPPSAGEGLPVGGPPSDRSPAGRDAAGSHSRGSMRRRVVGQEEDGGDPGAGTTAVQQGGGLSQGQGRGQQELVWMVREFRPRRRRGLVPLVTVEEPPQQQ